MSEEVIRPQLVLPAPVSRPLAMQSRAELQRVCARQTAELQDVHGYYRGMRQAMLLRIVEAEVDLAWATVAVLALQQFVAGACTEDCEGCAECYEDQDPHSMGWVDGRGRP